MKIVFGGLLAMGALFAQESLLVKDAQGQWKQASTNLVKAAQKMPAEKYDYKASPEVRTFGGFVGHVADAGVLFCAAAAGEKKSPPGAEKGLKDKAALVKALEETVAYCDKVYSGLGEKALDSVKFFGQDRTKIGVLFFNNMHMYEHYGNIVTYMRANGLVPPSSEGR
ncbi:MAG: DinB family protein [Acidobacteria bacterium]|nr:DinB family protein [Acidobacteriota bacterium]